MVKSPLAVKSDATHIRNVLSVDIVRAYNRQLGINVESVFEGIERISVYECQESGYRFYHPFNVAGDSSFYEKLQVHDWYYMQWKWEHEVCAGLIKDGSKVLEVGCGKGAFLDKISQNIAGLTCIGLEMNKSSVLTNSRFQIIDGTIEEFSGEHADEFDLVCSFQVLEHVPQVRSFLAAQVKCLKPGGRLVICVPNNDSFMGENEFSVLNLPPHHMGLWTERSLRSIGDVLGLKLINVEYEPLQPQHFDAYVKAKLDSMIGAFSSKVLRKLLKMTWLIKPMRNRKPTV
jgi:2-polyprenyl-3-methyl-5-hydroxy-6-metoxy-1,4-benzoquinol methylase